MPTNLLLLPLLGGYWFLHTLYYTRFRSQRLDGHRLLMESAFAGLLLTLVARVVVVFAQRSQVVQSAWSDIAPGLPFLGTASASLLLGIAAPYSQCLPRQNWYHVAPGCLDRGYRDRATLRLVLTVGYLSVYDQHGL